jgi:N-acetylglucosamine PTS system EIICBA or EIICB component
VVHIGNCATRLRITVKATSNLDEAKIKASGVSGVRIISDEAIQIIIGPEVQFTADAMNKIHHQL